jgi:hypothetical protein
MYRIKAQGYGGGGASIRPYVSDNLENIKSEMSDLLESDHAVQLYKIQDDGSEVRVDYEAASRGYTIYID